MRRYPGSRRAGNGFRGVGRTCPFLEPRPIPWTSREGRGVLVVRQGGGGVGAGRGLGRGVRGGGWYSGVAVSRDVVVQGEVSSAAVLWVPHARVSV